MIGDGTFVEKTVHIPTNLAERLSQFAQAQHVSENELIVNALLIFLTTIADASSGSYPWAALSESSFSKVWDNDYDALYDNWRELYGRQG